MYLPSLHFNIFKTLHLGYNMSLIHIRNLSHICQSELLRQRFLNNSRLEFLLRKFYSKKISLHTKSGTNFTQNVTSTKDEPTVQIKSVTEASSKLTELHSIKGWFTKNLTTESDNKKSWKQLSMQHKTGINLKGEALFGIHPVMNALNSQRRTIFNVYIHKNPTKTYSEDIQEIINKAVELKVPVSEVDWPTLKVVSDRKPHQGVCIDVSCYREDLYDLETGSQIVSSHPAPLYVVIHGILDPMNLGAIIRSSYYFSVDKVIRTANNCCSPTPMVSKASSGALEMMPLFVLQDSVQDLIKMHKEHGWRIVSTKASDPRVPDKRVFDVSDYTCNQPTLLFIGYEGTGVPKDVTDECDDIITILPTSATPGVDSLNTAVAHGIILHSLVKSRSHEDSMRQG